VIAYLDSSALLRLVLREPGALELDELTSRESIISSELLAIECPRTLDRLRLRGVLSTDEASSRVSVVRDFLEAIDLVLLRRPILARASEPFPTPLGTLDALHLSTALVWRDRMQKQLVMATHDEGLAVSARAYGFGILGSVRNDDAND
jgi:predicted nucleic acid-binding protein